MEDEDDAVIAASPRTKAGVAIVVVLFHAIAVLALIRAFAPDFTARAVESVVSTFTVTVTTPPPPEPVKDIGKAGASGEQGRTAVARAVKAEKPRIPVSRSSAPRAASTGSADTSGARETGSGTGAGGQGAGTGSGTGGTGQGGGLAGNAVHISGQINNARDFPVPPGGREARVGKSVILALTIDTDGQATACRIYRSSGLAETDEVACRLARQRLRFRPATNSLGEPIVSTFYWQQKFFF